MSDTPDYNIEGDTLETQAVYFINELCRDKDGGYIPCIACQGTTGYYKTDWNWGSDLAAAQAIADERNQRLGFTPIEAFKIVLSTMKGL